MMRARSVVGAGAALILTLTACGDEPPSNGSGYAAPADDFCGDLIDSAIPRPGRGIIDPWMAGGDVDAAATTATCTFTGGDHRIHVVVVVGAGADARYDESVDELESGAVGFEDPRAGSLEGWWSDGRRFEPARMPVRVADVVGGDGVFTRVDVVEYGGRRGGVPSRRTEAVDLAEAVTAAVPEVLGRS